MKLLTHIKTRIIFYSILTVSIALGGCGGGGSSKSSVPASSAPASAVASSAPASIAASSTPASIAASSTPSSVAVSSSSLSSSSLMSSASNSSISSAATSVNAAAAIIRDQGGMHFYYARDWDIARGQLVGTEVQTYEHYESDTFVSKTPRTAPDLIVLGPNGWAPEENVKQVASFNSDGTVTTHNHTSYDTEAILSVTGIIDVSGQNIVAVLNGHANTSEMLAAVNPAATFAGSALAYQVAIARPHPTYSVYFNAGDVDGKCWGGEDLASASGGNCVSVPMAVGNSVFEKAVAGYANLFSEDVAVNTTSYRAVVIGQIGPNKLEIQIVNDAGKTLRFYENAWDGSFSQLLATSTWSELTLPYLATDNKAVQVEYPEQLRYALWAGPIAGTIFAQQDNYLRTIGKWEMSDADKVAVTFNGVANTSISNATAGYSNPLVGNWKFGDDYFIFSNNNTFTQVKTATDDPDCVAGSASGRYSWNPLTSMVNVKLQTDATAADPDDSCAFDGKVQLTLSGNNFSFMNEDGILTFTKVTSSTGLVGTWVRSEAEGYTVILFTSTQYFLSSYHLDGGRYGTESGTYVFNEGTATFTPSVVKDNNDDAGFSDDNNQPLSLVIAGDNNSFNIDGTVLHRLK